tara:strand:+ start:57 stop:626 length:570 start_codon:yes stop_codon:yes gene_type:complete
MERKSIPKPLRVQVWNKYIGEENGIGKCDVCSIEIKVSNYDCGHIIAAIDGGEDIINNLVPICRLCNLSMGKENLNDFKTKYFSNKSYVDIYIKCFLKKTDELIKVKGFMGFKEYEYPCFLSLDSIYNEYKRWLYYNHIYYYEQIGMNRWILKPDKKELQESIIKIYGSLLKDPSMMYGEWGFININFK